MSDEQKTDLQNTNSEKTQNNSDNELNTQLGTEETTEKNPNETINTNSEFFGKPEKYDYADVKLPENMQFDEHLTNKFNDYALKLNLSQKGANELMSYAIELSEQTRTQTVEAMQKLQQDKIESYKSDLNRDSEIGGANLKSSLETANLAYDGFFNDVGLRQLLAESGLTVHPKFIKSLKAIGEQMREDKIHSSQYGSSDKESREDILFPTMKSKDE